MTTKRIEDMTRAEFIRKYQVLKNSGVPTEAEIAERFHRIVSLKSSVDAGLLNENIGQKPSHPACKDDEHGKHAKPQ
ncbi:MAG: hypothetical protein U9R74_16680 [Pseudomonadota bacterium]|nr:hypothetical protein [Pseudomonadota bacterium]